MPPADLSVDDILSGNNADAPTPNEDPLDPGKTLPPAPASGESGDVIPVAENPAEGGDPPPEPPLTEGTDANQTEQPVDVSTDEGALPQQQSQPCQPTVPTSSSSNEFAVIEASLGHLEQVVSSISESSAKTAVEIRDMHKLYHNEFASRLKSMQDELEHYREIDKGRIFDGILVEVAKLYSANESVIDDITDEKIKKRISYMLMDILQILETYGVSKQKSSPGDKRNARYCQVVERIGTDNQDLHDTVVQSRSTGFYVENRSLLKEFVDIYIYSQQTGEQSVEK